MLEWIEILNYVFVFFRNSCCCCAMSTHRKLPRRRQQAHSSSACMILWHSKTPPPSTRRKNRKNPPIHWAFDHQRSVPPLFLTYNKSLSHILGFILTTQLEDRVTDELPVLYHPPHKSYSAHAPRSTDFHEFSFSFLSKFRNQSILDYSIQLLCSTKEEK